LPLLIDCRCRHAIIDTLLIISSASLLRDAAIRHAMPLSPCRHLLRHATLPPFSICCCHFARLLISICRHCIADADIAISSPHATPPAAAFDAAMLMLFDAFAARWRLISADIDSLRHTAAAAIFMR
jgi:hypothetical protein